MMESRHILYLINEGYDLKQASTFVGNHFLLSERQRLAIMRSIATNDQLAMIARSDNQLYWCSVKEGHLTLLIIIRWTSAVSR